MRELPTPRGRDWDDGGVSPDPEPVRRPVAGPPPPSKPPRSALTVRDMLVALAVLVGVVLLVGGLSGSCSFSPAGPTVDATRLPVVDAPAELRALAPTVPFAVRVPAVPAGWRANSVDQDAVAGGRVVRTGFVLPDGRYLRVLQSDVAEEVLLAAEAGAEPVPAKGAVDAGGLRWVVYGRDDDEPIWIGELVAPAPVRVLITGSGSEDGFHALAGAVVSGELLPPGAAPR